MSSTDVTSSETTIAEFLRTNSSASRRPVERSLPDGSYTGPGRYRHYKGADYEVFGLGRHESEGTLLVVYRPVDGSVVSRSGDDQTLLIPFDMWLRPLDDFNATVTVNGREEPRFRRLPD